MLAIVVGGSGGIGAAIVAAFQNEPEISAIVATYRTARPATIASGCPEPQTPIDWFQLDLADEPAIAGFADYIDSQLQMLATDADSKPASIRYLINCVGVLHDDRLSPEKSIRSFSGDALANAIAVNTTPTLLLAKHMEPLLKQLKQDTHKLKQDTHLQLKLDTHKNQKQDTHLKLDTHCVFATVSARVGSISDNRLGGWYSYRLSKAALNMAIKTLSIEWRRLHPEVSVVALHPGTTATALSKPFQRNVPDGKLFTAEQTATLLTEVLRSLEPGRTGEFLSWDGTSIPW